MGPMGHPSAGVESNNIAPSHDGKALDPSRVVLQFVCDVVYIRGSASRSSNHCPHPNHSIRSVLVTMAPKTTWAELARLGWLKQQVFEILNAQRGGTMTGGAQNDMALNQGFAEDWR